jgi:hypothetical protein
MIGGDDQARYQLPAGNVFSASTLPNWALWDQERAAGGGAQETQSNRRAPPGCDDRAGGQPDRAEHGDRRPPTPRANGQRMCAVRMASWFGAKVRVRSRSTRQAAEAARSGDLPADYRAARDV